MKPEIGLLDKNRDAVVKILNTTLSDEMVRLVKRRNYHWNAPGPRLKDFNNFLAAQSSDLNEIVDDVAERARILGGIRFGPRGEFQKQSRLKEHPGQPPSP